MKADIKAERTRSYFLEAAKEIILSEGAESVSVRKIAGKSGYSYATIYHYFRDLDALLFEVKNSLIQDMMKNLGGFGMTDRWTLDQVKQFNRVFLGYFIHHPHVYNFLYRYPLKNTSVPGFDNLEVGESSWDSYKGFVEAGVITAEEVPFIAKTLIYAMYGLLGLYFSSNGLTEEKLLADMDQMTDHLLMK